MKAPDEEPELPSVSPGNNSPCLSIVHSHPPPSQHVGMEWSLEQASARILSSAAWDSSPEPKLLHDKLLDTGWKYLETFRLHI